MPVDFSRGTKVNKNLPSNNTMLNPSSMLSFFTLFITFIVLLKVYSKYAKGDNTLAKYFAKW